MTCAALRSLSRCHARSDPRVAGGRFDTCGNLVEASVDVRSLDWSPECLLSARSVELFTHCFRQLDSMASLHTARHVNMRKGNDV